MSRQGQGHLPYALETTVYEQFCVSALPRLLLATSGRETSDSSLQSLARNVVGMLWHAVMCFDVPCCSKPISAL